MDSASTSDNTKSRRIGLLSDVHGNMTALRAVLADAGARDVTEFWLLGDTVMPGPGTLDLFGLIDATNITHCIRGNWDDCLLGTMAGDIDLGNPTDVYLARLSQYVYDNIGDDGVARVASWPLWQVTELGPLKVLICHNLPNKNWGQDLMRACDQGNFDAIFDGVEADIAVIGHTHSPFMRYASDGQMIINPGSVGQSPIYDAGPAGDLRARYAILVVDELGIADVEFRRVDYDRHAEMALAERAGLPYLGLYKESLTTGLTHQHDHELLQELSDHLGYLEQVTAFLADHE